MTTDKRVEFQVHLSDTETEATSWSIADMDCIENRLQREIYGITSNDQMHFQQQSSIGLIKFEA
jgi:hypothetical protein